MEEVGSHPAEDYTSDDVRGVERMSWDVEVEVNLLTVGFELERIIARYCD